MNTIAHVTKPLADLWNYYTHDANLEQLLSFRGGYSGGNDWHSKYLRSEQDVLRNEFDELSARFNEEPRLLDLVWDNKWRLTALAGVERLISARQAHSGLKVRFYVPDNNRAVLQQIFNQGVLGGYFRGYLLNLAQFVGVGYHSLLWSHKTNYLNHFAISSLFEALLFPLDTIKTLIYADLQGKYKGYLDCLGKIVENNGYEHLWRGLSYKLIYNGFFVWNLRNIYEDSPLAYISTPAWLLSYALLSFKTRLQVADTCLSFNNAENGDKYLLALTKNTSLRGLYGGVLPFAVLNLAFMWTFYGLYSKEAQERVAESFVERSREFRSPAAEKLWS